MFALYYISFFYMMAIGLGAVNEALDHPNPLWLVPVQYGMLCPYLFFGLKRVYRQSAGRTVLKTLAILAVAFLIDIPINIAAQRLTVALS